MSDPLDDVDNKTESKYNCIKDKLYNFFNDHPKDVGMTYWTHFLHASGTGVKSVGAGLILVIHAILPGIFKKTASNIILNVNATLQGPYNAKSE